MEPWHRVAADPRVEEAIGAAEHLSAVVPVPTCSSTQDVAVRCAAEGAASGAVVVTGVQTAGRGRTGRGWDDDGSGGSLALSILLDVAGPPDAPGRATPLVPHSLGLAVLAGARAVGVDGLALKWPNDVLHRTDGGPRKVCGILVERTTVGDRDVLVAGIGINVDHRHLPELVDRTSLAQLGAAGDVDRVGLLVGLLGAVDRRLGMLGADVDVLLDDYRRASDTIGRTVVVQRPGVTDLEGTVETVDGEGRLVVRTSDGEQHVLLSGTVRDAVRRR